MTIVGVVGDVKQYGLNRAATDEFYVPLESNSLLQAAILIRTAINPLQMNKEIVKAVHEIDPQQPVIRVMTLEQIRNEWLASPRLTAILITLFAGLALVITLAGISGVMALTVSQRTREIGVRIALGAQRSNVLGLVLREGLQVLAFGLLLGLVGALSATRIMRSLLYSTSATDALSFIATSFTLIAVALVACYIPARRATRVDPMVALRYE